MKPTNSLCVLGLGYIDLPTAAMLALSPAEGFATHGNQLCMNQTFAV